MAAPVSQVSLSVTTSVTAVVAPADCVSVNVQQKQGTAPPAPKFKVYAPDGTTLLSTQQAGVNYQFNAPAGTKYLQGQIVGYIAVVTGSATTVFTVFADPIAPGQTLPGVVGQMVQLTLTTAQLLALQTTAVALVPAPPVGFMLIARKLVLQYKYGATAFTIGNADNTVRLQYTGKTTALIAPAATGLVDQTANTTIAQGPAVAQAALAQTNVEALGLELKLAGTTPALTLGDGTVVASLIYDTVPLQ